MDKLDGTLFQPKDLLANAFAATHNLGMLAFEPVIFQHTGVYSSVTNRKIDKESVSNWIMFSEYFEAKGKPVVFDPTLWSE